MSQLICSLCKADLWCEPHSVHCEHHVEIDQEAFEEAMKKAYNKCTRGGKNDPSTD